MNPNKLTIECPAGVEIKATVLGEQQSVLSTQALQFVADLHREFNTERRQRLLRRAEAITAIQQGQMPVFPDETRTVRQADWQVAPILPDLADRRVEITGPTDRKMIINALNSGASTYMADLEDSNAPTWNNMVNGQVNLRDANRKTISLATDSGKEYRLREDCATLLVRPRGLHLVEKHMTVDGKPVSASLFDFGLYFFHNARHLLEKGGGPYFYLPKLENHLEARFWNEVFCMAQDRLDMPRGSVRATVLIEHILATFQAEEILYELRDHSSGLNCGRWDYIFSVIKTFRHLPEFVLPDRSQITMNRHMMHAYTLHVIRTCHKRGAHAIGGMAAQIPIKNDPAANEAAMAKVREDKEREVRSGHDGTWVAHPGLVETAKRIFDQHMPDVHQIVDKCDDITVAPSDLLKVPEGTITEPGLRTNISVGIAYLDAWLGGNGCVPLNHLMEDAATCEISRAQLWQWIRHDNAVLDDGRPVTAELVQTMIDHETEQWQQSPENSNLDRERYNLATALFKKITGSEELIEFLTLPAYDHLD